MLIRTVIAALVMALSLGASANAQQTPPTTQTKPADQAASAPPSRPDPPGMNANVKLELTITDQSGAGEPLKKVVTMLVADRGMGSIRSSGSVRTQGRVQINVDARPTIIANSQLIRLGLGLEYNPRTLGQDSPTEWSTLNEQFAVVLEAGKPLVISQAADPTSDRKITVEVRATILK